MKNYLKLVDFELKRFWKIYAVLIGIIVVGESLAVINNTKKLAFDIKVNATSLVTNNSGGSISEFYSLEDVTNSMLFVLPVILCIAVLVMYVFFIWYRDWFGKNTFGFQMLLLPCNRMAIFYAKLTTILLYVFGCLAIQLAMYPLLNGLFASVLPDTFFKDGGITNWINGSDLLSVLTPSILSDFLLFYFYGITSVIVLFTVILIERSYRLKGIVLGLIYAIFCVFVLLIPFFVDSVIRLYQTEFVIVGLISNIVTLLVSLGFSTFLINKKIWI